MEGVVATVAGYAGGKKEAPTYRSIGDHTETVLVAFDKTKITYEALLKAFWSDHNPGAGSFSTQYRNVALPTTDAQLSAALASKKEVEAKSGRMVRTQVEQAGTFYPAEDYHQKYYLKQRPDLLRLVRKKYPGEAAFIASTLAARINGYLGEGGSQSDIDKALAKEGL